MCEVQCKTEKIWLIWIKLKSDKFGKPTATWNRILDLVRIESKNANVHDWVNLDHNSLIRFCSILPPNRIQDSSLTKTSWKRLSNTHAMDWFADCPLCKSLKKSIIFSPFLTARYAYKDYLITLAWLQTMIKRRSTTHIKRKYIYIYLNSNQWRRNKYHLHNVLV